MREHLQERENLKRFVEQLVHGQVPQKELLPQMWQKSFEDAWCGWEEVAKYLEQLAQGDWTIQPPQGKSIVCQHARALHLMLQMQCSQCQQIEGAISAQTEQAEPCEQDMLTMQQVMFHVITHTHSCVIAMELQSGKLIYQNAHYQQWQENHFLKKKQVDKSLSLWPIKQKPIWYITIGCDQCATKEAIQILMVQSFLWSWQGKPAVIHVLTDYSEEHMRQKRMEQAAFTDALTGLYNRRYGQIQVSRLMENNIPFLFCFLDMDGLKLINDTLGHAKGDVAILAVAGALQQVFRQDDTMIRLGGDEFVVILPRCSVELAEKRFKMAHDLLKNTELEFPITFSYGIESVSVGEQRNIEEIFSTADQKMYCHKQEKRKK